MAIKRKYEEGELNASGFPTGLGEALKPQKLATPPSKADPNAQANAGYVNALYQEKYQRDATQAELDKFTQNTVKDASNLILGQEMSPFRDINTALEPAPDEIDTELGQDELLEDLTKDNPTFGYQDQINAINAENEKLQAENLALIEEKKLIEEKRKEDSRNAIEAGIGERELTQEEKEADYKLLEKEEYLDNLSSLNDQYSSLVDAKTSFMERMLLERGPDALNKPSVIRALNNYDTNIQNVSVLKDLASGNLDNARITIDGFYSSKLDVINDNEETYKTLYNMANNNLIDLSKDEKEILDEKKAEAEEEKAKIEEKQDTIVSLLEDGNINERAFRDYGLSLDDEPEEMMRKVNKAAQDQITINSLISKYPAVNITSNMSLGDARTLIRNSTGDDLETITQDGKIYSFNKTTGELTLLSGEEDARKYNLQIDENGNLVKVYEQDEEFIQMMNAVESALKNNVGMNFATGTEPLSQKTYFNLFGSKDKKQEFIADAQYISSNLSLESLIAAKERGATFGALSDNELRMLSSAATKLGFYAKEKDGKVVGFDASAKAVAKEINRIKELLQKAAGPSKEIVEKSGKQLVSEAYTKTPEVRNAINAMVDAGLSYDDISEALNLKQPESGSGEIKTYETGAKAGQCGVYINKTAGIRVGNNKQDKINNVDKYGSKGTSGIKEGDVIVQNIGTYGHVALVTSINPDGTVTLSESNYKNDEKVTNNRKISLNDTSIYGYLRPSNQTSNTLLI